MEWREATPEGGQHRSGAGEGVRLVDRRTVTTPTALLQPGDHRVDTSITCVLTRFRLRSLWDLVAIRREYRSVERASRGVPGYMSSAFAVENRTTCFVLSVWKSASAIPGYGTSVPAHVLAARKLFARARVDAAGNPEVWSTKWTLQSVSNNLNWEGLDLRAHLMAANGSAG